MTYHLPFKNLFCLLLIWNDAIYQSDIIIGFVVWTKVLVLYCIVLYYSVD